MKTIINNNLNKTILPNYSSINSIRESGYSCTEESKLEVPTKISELIDDVGLIKDPSYQHTDNNYTDDDKAIVQSGKEWPETIEAMKKATEETIEIISEAQEVTNNPPKIQNETWWIWDKTTNTYKDSGIKAIGAPFVIVKTYSSIEEMQDDFSNSSVKLHEFVMIDSNIEDPDNSKLYMKSETEWKFISDLSGATGITGQSAYQLAVQQGFEGTEKEWIQSLKQPALDAAEETNSVIQEANEIISTLNNLEQTVSSQEQIRQNQEETRQTNTALAISKAEVATSKAELATTEANLAKDAANNAADRANLAAGEVETIKNQVEQAVQDAEKAVEDANTAITTANKATELANAAATNANEKANLAEEKAESANVAASNANEKANLANTAATNANEKANLADSAAQTANIATESANTATQEANKQADRAKNFADNPPKIQEGTWWVWDENSSTYKNTNINATGPQGEIGLAATIKVGSVTNGEEVSIKNSGTENNAIFDFVLQKGDRGEPGKSPKIQDGTWWVWDEETSDYVNSNISVSSDYVLTKEKVENVLIGDITTHNHNTTYYSKTEIDQKLEEFQPAITIDDNLNDSSTNPVQNKVIKSALDEKADSTDIVDMLTKTEASTTYQPIGDYASTSDLNNKQDTLISGTNIKTVNSQSILGEGNIQIEIPEGGITDAPIDDKIYGRKNGNWTETVEKVHTHTKSDISDFPNNISEFNNDSNYITEEVLTAKDYATNTSLNNKVDKEEGKSLSTNDFTTELKTKLDNIAQGAEVNVQSDWNEISSDSDAFIKNKPDVYLKSETYNKTEIDQAIKNAQVPGVYKYKGSKPTYSDLPSDDNEIGDVWNVVKNDINYAWTGSDWDPLGGTSEKASSTIDGLMSKEDFNKLSGIESGAQVNKVNSVAGREGDVTLTKTDVGLDQVDNTSDLNKPISTATQAALNEKASKEEAIEIIINNGITPENSEKLWIDLSDDSEYLDNLILEAPKNNKQYIRKNGEWVELIDAVSDNNIYGRKNGEWVKTVLFFNNIEASNWESNELYEDFNYKCNLTCNGVNNSDYAEVVFNLSDSLTGDYASICNTDTNIVTIYSKKNKTITVPTIVITKL